MQREESVCVCVCLSLRVWSYESRCLRDTFSGISPVSQQSVVILTLSDCRVSRQSQKLDTTIVCERPFLQLS